MERLEIKDGCVSFRRDLGRRYDGPVLNSSTPGGIAVNYISCKEKPLNVNVSGFFCFCIPNCNFKEVS